MIGTQTPLLFALNFKNPRGRILRRQWTQPHVTVPDYHHWRMFKDNVTMPEQALNIPSLSLIRQNEKFCFPCDNSVIRIRKNFVSSRCFGSSIVNKDNMVFGIKETSALVDSKTAIEDTLLNFETKKSTDRRCEFWLEFENGAKMFAEMSDHVDPQFDAIPPLQSDNINIDAEPSKQVVIREDGINENSLYVQSDVMKQSGEGRGILRTN